MVTLEQLAEAVLQRNSLLARSLAQDFLRETESLIGIADAGRKHTVPTGRDALAQCHRRRRQDRCEVQAQQ